MPIEETFEKAIKVIKDNPDREFWAISWMQRMLKIGYNLSSDVRDLAIKKGIVAELPDKDNKYKIYREKL